MKYILEIFFDEVLNELREKENIDEKTFWELYKKIVIYEMDILNENMPHHYKKLDFETANDMFDKVLKIIKKRNEITIFLHQFPIYF